MAGLVPLTFGAELEFADVLYGQPLPEGCSWNRQDYSLVNSNGIANCPIGKYYQYGGEINTKPTCTVEEQSQLFREILGILDPKPVINYRCNLHIHVGLKGLSQDLEALKKLLLYIDTWQRRIFEIIEPVPRPQHGQYPKEEAYKGAMKRYRRRHQSHQSVLGPTQVSRMLQSKTTEEFYLSHFVTDKNGVPQKQLHQRCGINLRSLWENNETIEFRHFPGTIKLEQFDSCLRWCEAFTEAALVTDESPEIIVTRLSNLDFPKFYPYDHELEKGWEKTSHHVKPLEREKNIAALQTAR